MSLFWTWNFPLNFQKFHFNSKVIVWFDSFLAYKLLSLVGTLCSKRFWFVFFFSIDNWRRKIEGTERVNLREIFIKKQIQNPIMDVIGNLHAKLPIETLSSDVLKSGELKCLEKSLSSPSRTSWLKLWPLSSCHKNSSKLNLMMLFFSSVKTSSEIIELNH